MKKLFALFAALFLIGCSGGTPVKPDPDTQVEGMTAAPVLEHDYDYVSWAEAAELIADCKVTMTAELHSGEVHLTQDNGEIVAVKSYDQAELQAGIQEANAKCDTRIGVAME